MTFIEGCIQPVGPYHDHRIPDSAGKHLLKARQAFYISRTSKEVPRGDEYCGDDDRLDRNCCFLSHTFDPTCVMSQNWRSAHSQRKKVEAMMFECAMV
jgi:hypothetical protein